MTEEKPQSLRWGELTEELTDSLALALARARRAALKGESKDAIDRLEELRAVSGTHAYLPASLMLGEVYRDCGEIRAAVKMFRLVEKRLEAGELSKTALNLGLAWQSVGHPGCARKAYANIVRDFPFAELKSGGDERTTRIAAIAAYRLGWLTIGDEIDEAWTWWRRALETGVVEVAPHAALALAMEIGHARLYSARIEELFRQVVDADHPHASPRAALELGKLFAQRLQFSQAEEFLKCAIESQHPHCVGEAEETLRGLRRPSSPSGGTGGSAPGTGLPLSTLSGSEIEARQVSAAREKKRRVLLVGAGTGGQYLLESLLRSEKPYEICGFVDDEATEVPEHLKAPILGKIANLSTILDSQAPHEVFMAIPTAPGGVRARVVRACREARIPLLNLPTMHELRHDHNLFAQLRPVRIEETYGANPVLVDRGALTGLHDRSVLLIGGAGTIGSAIARRLASGQVRYLVLLDRNETSLEQLSRELSAELRFSRVFPLLGDASDETALEQAFELCRPSHVFFTAGSANPRLFEDNLVSAVRDEVLGGELAARCIVEHGVSSLLYISSSFAAKPSTPFAAAKALSELAVHAACQDSPTSCVTLRTGSLFRSPGSPVRIIERQIELGEHVTVGGADLWRRFLTATRAAELCLRAVRVGTPGQRLAIDAGEELNVREMATEMVRLAGNMVDIDTRVDHSPVLTQLPDSDVFAGDDESIAATPHNELVALLGRRPEAAFVQAALDRLRPPIADRDPLAVRRTLMEQVESLTERESSARAGFSHPPESNLVGRPDC
jgi:nucleoside-diphosphate-sugar epimerase